MSTWAWAVFTVMAACAQALRNAMQKELTRTLGTAGATHVRFLYGLPFALVFLGIVLVASGYRLPQPSLLWLQWLVVGSLTQVIATAMLLTAMKERSFVVVTALIKVEPVHVALFGLVFLGDRLSLGLAVAIALATIGVTIMTWPKEQARDIMSWRSAAIGLAAGAVFGFSAIGYRGAVLALHDDNFVLAATSTLVAGLTLQVIVLTSYLILRERATLVALAHAWRPSITAGFMGAFASLMWFLALALESAAKVRTLALVEIFVAQMIAGTFFRQRLASREGLGILIIIAGVALLLNQ